MLYETRDSNYVKSEVENGETWKKYSEGCVSVVICLIPNVRFTLVHEMKLVWLI